MTEVRDYEQIDDFLGEPNTKTRQIEENLAKLPEDQLAQINDGLRFLDTDQDRYREWRDQLAEGHYTTMHSELLIVSHFRRQLGEDAVTLSKESLLLGKTSIQLSSGMALSSGSRC